MVLKKSNSYQQKSTTNNNNHNIEVSLNLKFGNSIENTLLEENDKENEVEKKVKKFIDLIQKKIKFEKVFSIFTITKPKLLQVKKNKKKRI